MTIAQTLQWIQTMPNLWADARYKSRHELSNERLSPAIPLHMHQKSGFFALNLPDVRDGGPGFRNYPLDASLRRSEPAKYMWRQLHF